jgi:hypothetical protein
MENSTLSRHIGALYPVGGRVKYMILDVGCDAMGHLRKATGKPR